jgi:tetratricopeptide (TPR) repeat protein
MHFEFSEATHQWCGQCGANIRRPASWCRFCHKHIASKFLCKDRNVDPSMIIDGAASWLPNFDDLVLSSAPGLQERFRQAYVATAHSFNESEKIYLARQLSHRSESACRELPPEPRVAGLLQDILLHLQECGEDIQRLCEDPRLILLETTPATIINEAELRLMEQSAGNPCKFCQEFNLTTAERCRFCESSGTEPPDQLSEGALRPQLDPELLTEVMLWESARLQAESLPPLPAEILESYHITSATIEMEITRQGLNPNDFPMSRWRRKILELHLKTERTFEETEMEDLLNLGSACSWSKKDIEAEIVFRHGLRRLMNYEHLRLPKQRMIDGLAQLYLFRKDYENHHRLNQEATALRLSKLPEPMRQLSIDSEKDKQSMLMRISENAEVDPRKHIEQTEERLKKLQKMQSQMIDQASTPEHKKFLESQRSRLNKVLGPGMEIAKLRIDADEARKAGDFDRAGSLLEDALSKLGDEINDVRTRSGLFSQLAQIQHLQGKHAIAADTHQKAISVAEELGDLHDGREDIPVGEACFLYAQFLMRLERYSEAEKYFMRALEMDRQFQERFDRDFERSIPSASETEANIKEELAKLLRCTNRAAQADETEAQVADIKRNIAEREQRLADDRRNFLEKMPGEKQQKPS